MDEPSEPVVSESPAELARKGALALSSLSGAAVWWIAAQGLGFLSVVIVSRALGPEGYGRLGLAMAIGTYLCFINQWGIDVLLARMLVRDGPANAGRHLAAFLRQKQVSGAILFAAVAAACASGIAGRESGLVFVGAISGLSLSLTVPAAFDAQRRQGTYLAFASARQLFFVLATFVLWKSGSAALPLVLGILIADATSVILQIALEWGWIRKTFGPLQWNNASAEARELWRSAIPTALAYTSLQALTLSGPVLIEMFGDKHELGALVASNQLATVAASLAGLLTRAVHVRLAAIPDAHGALFRRRVWLSTLGMTGLGVAAAIPFLFVSDWSVQLVFGQRFNAAAPLLSIDVWRVAGMLASAVLGSALICQQRVRAYAACHVLAMIAGLAVAIVYVPTRGAIAAVAGVAIGRAAFAIFAAIVLCLSSARKTEA